MSTNPHGQTLPARQGNKEVTYVQLPLDEQLVLKVIPMPRDCNINGDIFGGWVMAQVDLAGAVAAALCQGPHGDGGGE